MPDITIFQVFSALTVTLILTPVFSRLYQGLSRKSSDPPVVPYWFPIVGSTIIYGIDPFKFFFACQKKYGDIFTFVLLGRKITVYLGQKGNQFILNGKHKDLNAEEIYSVLTTPVFGKDVVYDCPNAKFMEQKKFLKAGLASSALRSYVPLMESEMKGYLTSSATFQDSSGTLSITKTMAEITLFTAARTLQGVEVREKLDTTFAQLYHALDDGFQPINFMLPWFPLPRNRRRDIAQRKLTQLYGDIIRSRRENPSQDSEDVLWTLMSSVYKDGTPMPDDEIAHLMIALLMGGQHNTSAASAWILLHLAAAPSIQEELYQEQLAVLGDATAPLDQDKLSELTLLSDVIKETLRLHPAIHSILRKVKNPLPVQGSSIVVPASHVLLASPAAMGKSDEYFPHADQWDPCRWRKIQDPKDQEKEMADYGYGLVSTGADSMYLPFGAGRHRCIGESFATLQLSVVVTLMVRHFRFQNLDGKEGVVDTDYSSMFLRPQDPAIIQWTRRQV